MQQSMDIIHLNKQLQQEEKQLKKPRKKKDNSKKTDYFVNCRCCGQYIRGDYRSNFDKRYCQDCL